MTAAKRSSQAHRETGESFDFNAAILAKIREISAATREVEQAKDACKTDPSSGNLGKFRIQKEKEVQLRAQLRGLKVPKKRFEEESAGARLGALREVQGLLHKGPAANIDALEVGSGKLESGEIHVGHVSQLAKESFRLLLAVHDLSSEIYELAADLPLCERQEDRDYLEEIIVNKTIERDQLLNRRQLLSISIQQARKKTEAS